MFDVLIAVMDLIGFAGFIVALVFSIESQDHTHWLSEAWLIIALGNFFAASWAFTTALQWLDIYPAVLDQVDQALLAVAVGLYLAFALLIARGAVKPV